LDETAQHLRRDGRPILTLIDAPIPTGVAVRPLTDPVPLYPWTMVFRRDLRHPGLDALEASVVDLAQRERWRELPPDPWISEPDAVVVEDAPPPTAGPGSGFND
jgi:hypothetical protein